MMSTLLLLAACTEETTVTYEQYNAEDNEVTVQVGAETSYQVDESGMQLLDEDGNPIPVDATCSLTSNTGEVEIGTGTASPAAGPIGTVHTVRVELFEDYAGDVDRVTVRTDSGDRGEDEYDLEADSTGEGVWLFQLQSVGEDGETREDTFTFRLFTAEEGTTSDTGDNGSIFEGLF